MSGSLPQFSEDLRQHLSRLQTSLGNINGLFTGALTDAELACRVDDLRVVIEQYSERAVERRETLQVGCERAGTVTDDTVSRWIDTRQTAQLHARADLLEQLATIALELASLDVLQAEHIAAAAIVARRQAVAVQIQRAAPPLSDRRTD